MFIGIWANGRYPLGNIHIDSVFLACKNLVDIQNRTEAALKIFTDYSQRSFLANLYLTEA